MIDTIVNAVLWEDFVEIKCCELAKFQDLRINLRYQSSFQQI